MRESYAKNAKENKKIKGNTKSKKCIHRSLYSLFSSFASFA
jgi:hypothetical protein